MPFTLHAILNHIDRWLDLWYPENIYNGYFVSIILKRFSPVFKKDLLNLCSCKMPHDFTSSQKTVSGFWDTLSTCSFNISVLLQREHIRMVALAPGRIGTGIMLYRCPKILQNKRFMTSPGCGSNRIYTPCIQSVTEGRFPDVSCSLTSFNFAL